MGTAKCYESLCSPILVWTCLVILQGTSAIRNDQGSAASLDSAYFFYQEPAWPRDCKEVAERCSSGKSDGVHFIKPAGYPEPFEVYCDVSNNSTGWTVISRRLFGGHVNFSRGADSYMKGFGFLSHEFWIGNERLSYLTNQEKYQLLIEMTLSDSSVVNVSYHNFRVGDEFSQYKLLSISQYLGVTGNLSWCSSFDGIHEGVCTPADCLGVYESGSTISGVYSIKPTNWSGAPFRVYCNMTDGGGWTVFQRRVDGSVDFFLDWDDYKEGFGDVDHEHWLGNEKLYYLSNQRDYQIRIDVVNTDGDPYYAIFNSFRIDSEDQNYKLSVVGDYSGNADACGYNGSNTLIRHQGAEFSTRDRDNDDYEELSLPDYSIIVGYNASCAQGYHGAWWYTEDCDYECETHYTNLNGRYPDYFWMDCLPGSSDLIFSEMKLRPM